MLLFRWTAFKFHLSSHLDRWTHPCCAGCMKKKQKKNPEPSMLESVKRV